MKKIVLLTVIFMTSLFYEASAQRLPKHDYYVTVYQITVPMVGSSVSINYGVGLPLGKAMAISNDAGTAPLSFDNAIGAVNYLASRGWELVTTCVEEHKSSRTNLYIMRLDGSKNIQSPLTKAIDELLDKVEK